MTSFKITSDDVAVRGLQENNKTPVVSSPVAPVKASNPVQKSPENKTLQSLEVNRRNNDPDQSQRRQTERRKTEGSTLFDTRSAQERRTKIGRASDTGKDSSITKPKGLNEIV